MSQLTVISDDNDQVNVNKKEERSKYQMEQVLHSLNLSKEFLVEGLARERIVTLA